MTDRRSGTWDRRAVVVPSDTAYIERRPERRKDAETRAAWDGLCASVSMLGTILPQSVAACCIRAGLRYRAAHPKAE